MSGPLDESLPMTPQRLVILKRIVARGRWIVKELEQLIIDVEYWGALPHNTEHAHKFDIEEQRVALAQERKNLAQAESLLARATGKA